VALAAPHPGPFHAGDRIEVIAAGTPGCDVRFDLGRMRVGVPLEQQSVVPDPRGDRAFYQGHYVLQGGELDGELPLYGTIRRREHKRAMLSRYRWDGSVALAVGR
ncbi:MAG TPA: hypothetical protein VK348_05600, partial [Planctomycetota bacterium]|nr:hypothetical protein [Planctomycetota bacterium]